MDLEADTATPLTPTESWPGHPLPKSDGPQPSGLGHLSDIRIIPYRFLVFRAFPGLDHVLGSGGRKMSFTVLWERQTLNK